MKSQLVLTLLLPGSVFMTGISGCNGSSTPTPPPNIIVSISAAAPQVEAGGTVALSGGAAGDPANKGVTWSISPSGAGSISNATAFSATYNAPATPPPSDLSVTITATAASDPTKSITVSIDVPPIIVSVVASVGAVGAVGAGSSSQITATVTNDPANKGVDPASWTISPATGAGTLSNQSGTSVTYTAPAMPPPNDVPVTISATSMSPAAQTGSITINFAAIRVSLSASPISVQACPALPCATGSSQITATVSFDPANQGVDPTSWKMTSPASGGGTLSNPTGTSVTYTAPSTPPTANLAVTITATSKADSTKSALVTVTVLAITISVSPISAIIPVSITQDFTATLANDPANAGVNWVLSQNATSCSGCGSITLSSTASGTPTTYTAPTALPTPTTVTLTPISATDTTKSAAATIALTTGSVKIAPASLEFGTVKTGRTKSLTTTLTNTGSSALSMTSITVTGANPPEFTLSTNNCGLSVAPGFSCTLIVTFRPAAPVGYGASLTISDSSTDSPQQVTLAGRGQFSRFPRTAVAQTSALTTPRPTGPNVVGTQVMDLVDPTRKDPFLGNGTARELLVRFWYPASSGENCQRADYVSPRVWSDFSRLMGVALPNVTTNSCWNTSIAAGAHPVVIFTHGYTGTFTDYTFLFEDLASRGYVVASVDHTFEATAVEFPDGRLVESVLGSHLANTMRADEAAMDFAVSVRLNDLSFVVNTLESLNVSDGGVFSAKLDMSRLALAGHSLGGLTAILGVEEGPRFRAGVILDGVMPNSELRGTDTPMLLLAAGRETWSPQETTWWSGLRGPRIAVNLRGAEHLTPSDAVWLAAGAVKTGTMGPDKTVAAVRNYVAAFLDAHLLGKPLDPLLTGPSSEFPDATVTTRKEPLRVKY